MCEVSCNTWPVTLRPFVGLPDLLVPGLLARRAHCQTDCAVRQTRRGVCVAVVCGCVCVMRCDASNTGLSHVVVNVCSKSTASEPIVPIRSLCLDWCTRLWDHVAALPRIQRVTPCATESWLDGALRLPLPELLPVAAAKRMGAATTVLTANTTVLTAKTAAVMTFTPCLPRRRRPLRLPHLGLHPHVLAQHETTYVVLLRGVCLHVLTIRFHVLFSALLAASGQCHNVGGAWVFS